MPQGYNCPGCSRVIVYGSNPCPRCNCALAWSQLGPVLYIPPTDASQQQVGNTPVEAPQQHVAQPATKPTDATKAKPPVWVIVLSVIIVLGFVAWVASSPTAFTPKPPVAHLNATVKASNYTVSVTNNDSQSWYGVKLLVNGFDYSYKAGTMEPGQTIQVSLNDFTTYEGDRFNPLLKKVQTVYIITEKPNGAGSYSFD
jgi:hypothetical protein